MLSIVKLIINVAACFLGLAIFLIVSNTKWGKENAKHAYAIAAGSLLAAVLIGGAAHLFVVRFLI